MWITPTYLAKLSPKKNYTGSIKNDCVSYTLMLRSLPLENTVITTWEVVCTSCERSEPTTGSTSCHSNEMLKYGGAFYDLVEDVFFYVLPYAYDPY